MNDISRPCTACAEREHCTGGNYQRCQKWCAWFHIHWSGLAGAEDRVKYKAWLMLLYQRATWEEK